MPHSTLGAIDPPFQHRKLHCPQELKRSFTILVAQSPPAGQDGGDSADFTNEHDWQRNFAPVALQIVAASKPKDGRETKTMHATRATELSQDSERQSTRLDERYGKIGISAVAAAVHHLGGRRSTYQPASFATETD
jgi:hypothetical protein